MERVSTWPRKAPRQDLTEEPPWRGKRPGKTWQEWAPNEAWYWALDISKEVAAQKIVEVKDSVEKYERKKAG